MARLLCEHFRHAVLIQDAAHVRLISVSVVGGFLIRSSSTGCSWHLTMPDFSALDERKTAMGRFGPNKPPETLRFLRVQVHLWSSDEAAGQRVVNEC